MGLQESFDKMLGLVTGSNDPMLLKSVIEVQRELVGLQEENRNLRNELHDLKNESIMESELTYRQGVYIRNNNFEDVFCGVCWDNNKKLSRVRKVRKSSVDTIDFSCDVCNQWRLSDIPFD